MTFCLIARNVSKVVLHHKPLLMIQLRMHAHQEKKDELTGRRLARARNWQVQKSDPYPDRFALQTDAACASAAAAMDVKSNEHKRDWAG